jgi:hypothetical protein
MAFRDLEEGIEALFDEAATAGKRYSTNYTHEVEVDNRLAKHLRGKANRPFAQNDRRRTQNAELRSRRVGRVVAPSIIERKPCPYCGAPRTHVLTGVRKGRIYHSGTRDSLYSPCVPLEMAAA